MWWGIYMPLYWYLLKTKEFITNTFSIFYFAYEFYHYTFLLNFIRLKKSVQCIFILHLVKVQFHCFFGMFNPKLKFIFFLFFYQFLNFSTLAGMCKITSHIYKYSCLSSQVSMPSLCLDSCVLSDQCYGFSTVRYIYFVSWRVCVVI